MADLHRTFSGSIPEYYDEWLGPAWFGPAARLLADCLPRDPGGDVLEIACGTGLMTRHLRERLAPAHRLVATDLSKAMLDYAQAKVKLPGIEWREADAMRLPFRDGEFGAVACGLGVMFMPDKQAFFGEARRMLPPGATFILSVWDKFEANPAAVAFARAVEGMAPGDPELRFRLPWEMHDEGVLRGHLADGGFQTVRIERKRIAVEGHSARRIATGQTRGTPRGALLEKKGISLDDAIDRVTEELVKIGGDPFRSEANVVLVEARAA